MRVGVGVGSGRGERGGHHFAAHGQALHQVVAGGHRVVTEAAILGLVEHTQSIPGEAKAGQSCWGDATDDGGMERDGAEEGWRGRGMERSLTHSLAERKNRREE